MAPPSLPLTFLFLLCFSLPPFFAMAAADNCASFLPPLKPCFDYISKTTSSITSCCDPLQTVLSNSTQFACICSYLSNPQYGTYIESALKLPQECKLSIVATQSNCSSTSTGSTPASSTPSGGTSATTSAAYLAYPIFALTFASAFSVVLL